MYAGLTPADKPALEAAKAAGAEWIVAQWGGKAFGYKEKPNREEISDECCYGSYFEWTPKQGDVEIELGIMPYPLVSYQNPEPVHIDTALSQIAGMEREQSGCEYCRDGKDLWEVAGCNKARVDPENKQLDVMDGYGDLYYCDINFCPMCGKNLKAEG